MSKWRNYLPLLNIYIEIPFISIRTQLMGERLEWMQREYIVLQIKIWKWCFEFELYDTYKRIENR